MTKQHEDEGPQQHLKQIPTAYELATVSILLARLRGERHPMICEALELFRHVELIRDKYKFKKGLELLDYTTMGKEIELEMLFTYNEPPVEPEPWWKALLREKAPRKKDADPKDRWQFCIKYPIKRNLALGWITDTNRRAAREKYLEAAGVPEEGDDIYNPRQFYALAQKLEPFLPFRGGVEPEPELTPAVVNGEAGRFEKAPTRRHKKTGRIAKIALREDNGRIPKKEKFD